MSFLVVMSLGRYFLNFLNRLSYYALTSSKSYFLNLCQNLFYTENSTGLELPHLA